MALKTAISIARTATHSNLEWKSGSAVVAVLVGILCAAGGAMCG